MGMQLMPIVMDDETVLYIQTVDTKQGGEVLASSADPVKATECFDKAMPAVTEFCQKTKGSLKERLNPDEIKLKFSLGFTGDLTAVIASAGAEVGLSVELVWKKEVK